MSSRDQVARTKLSSGKDDLEVYPPGYLCLPDIADNVGGSDCNEAREAAGLTSVVWPGYERLIDRGFLDEDDPVRRVWRQLVARYPNVPFPITLPPPAEL